MRSGQLIGGRYRLDTQIGSGAMGVVWQATDEVLDRVVALKGVVSVTAPRGSALIQRLRREATIVAKLHDPNVVSLFDVVREGDQWWLIMEYVPARSLADRPGTLTAEETARVGAQLASALETVHGAGIVHRDVKPGNVLLAKGLHVKLTDFGLSRVMAGDALPSDSGLLILGTPGYLAPEVARGEDPAPASDVFSLGATLFAAVEGESPFGIGGPRILVARARAEQINAPSRKSGPLAPVLSELLRAKPGQRPTAAQARRMLEKVVAGSPPRPRWHRWAPVVTGAVVTVLVLAGGLASDTSFESGARPDTALSVVGNPLTADPCALTDEAPLARFGQTERDPEYGNFNRCDIIVHSGNSNVDIDVELDSPPVPAGAVGKMGRFEVVRQSEDDGCERSLVLPDGNYVDIYAQQNGTGPADLCGMTDTAVTSATGVLDRGVIPRRTTPADPASLIHVNACSLLDASALSLYPGVDALHPKVGFGDWSCEWESTTQPTSLSLIFDRSQPPTVSDGTPIELAGHDAFVQAGGYSPDGCLVSIVHRQYIDGNGQPMDELVLVNLTGPRPPDQLCGLATELAGAAAAHLPPR